MTVAIYLRNYVRKIFNQGMQGLSAEYLQKMMSIFYQTLVAPGVEFAVKKHVFLVFESVLLVYQG
jgi:hypothetical protein